MKSVSPMGLAEWAMLIALSILWGGSFFFNELALDGLDPFTVVMWRVGIGGVALWLYLKARGRSLPKMGAAGGAFLVMGLLNNLIPFVLIVWGQARIDSGLASILNATTPLFTVTLAHFLTRDERMSWNKALGVILGIVGVAVMMAPGEIARVDADLLGQAAILVAALSYAGAGIFGRRLAEHPPTVSAAGMLLASAAMSIPTALLLGDPLSGIPSLPAFIGILCLGLVSTTLAYILYFRILARAGATNLLLVTLLVPVAAILLGVTVLGEVLAAAALTGMGLIAIGLAAVDGRLFTWRRAGS